MALGFSLTRHQFQTAVPANGNQYVWVGYHHEDYSEYTYFVGLCTFVRQADGTHIGIISSFQGLRIPPKLDREASRFIELSVATFEGQRPFLIALNQQVIAVSAAEANRLALAEVLVSICGHCELIEILD